MTYKEKGSYESTPPCNTESLISVFRGGVAWEISLGNRKREQQRKEKRERGRTRPVEDMGWLWLVDSLKLWVSFAKEPYKRDDILQKRPVILRSLLIVATPCQEEKHSESSLGL